MALPSELLGDVVTVLDDLEIPYFVTGSVASIAFGEYRATADVDIVASIQERHVQLLCAAFPQDRYYVDAQMVRDAVRGGGQFNVIDAQSGYKADIIIPDQSPLNAQRFARARRLRLTGANRAYWFSSPEDVILKKMEFFREGGSDKHLRDIAGIIKTMGDKLDRSYIERWAATLQVDGVWQAILKKANG